VGTSFLLLLGSSRAFRWFGASTSARIKIFFFVGEWEGEGAMAVILVVIVVGYNSFQIPQFLPRQLIFG
jgi:hypothetical protein